MVWNTGPLAFSKTCSALLVSGCLKISATTYDMTTTPRALRLNFQLVVRSLPIWARARSRAGANVRPPMGIIYLFRHEGQSARTDVAGASNPYPSSGSQERRQPQRARQTGRARVRHEDPNTWVGQTLMLTAALEAHGYLLPRVTEKGWRT